MWWMGLVALIIVALGVRAVLTKDEKARQKEIAKIIRLNLEDLFYECIYPGYAANGTIRFHSFCRRRRFLWGPWVIVIIISFREDIHVNVEDIVFQRLLRLVGERYFDQEVIVKPLFIKRRGKHGRLEISRPRRAV